MPVSSYHLVCFDTTVFGTAAEKHPVVFLVDWNIHAKPWVTGLAEITGLVNVFERLFSVLWQPRATCFTFGWQRVTSCLSRISDPGNRFFIILEPVLIYSYTKRCFRYG